MGVKQYLAILALMGLQGELTSLGNEMGSFVYEDDSPAAPPPRFREIQSGLPAGLSRQELLSVVDPDESSPWQFGWFTYGESNSRSVGVGLRGRSDPQLYVDINRDKRFSKQERFRRDTATETWQVPIGAEFITQLNDYTQVERSVWVRRSRRGDFLELATRGVMQGTVTAGGKSMAAVRFDRDSNGRWFDARDRVLLDISGDGAVDPIGGRIACDSVCRIDGKRFVMQSDNLGELLELVELTGTGRIVPQVRLQSENAVLSELSGAFVSGSGVRATIRAPDEVVECPVGNYRIESLTFKVSEGDRKYWFRFSALELADHPIVVSVDQTVNVDLLGEMTLNHQQAVVKVPGGAALKITPVLKTSSGLYLSGGKTGRSQPNLENRLISKSAFGDDVVDVNSTGFS